MQASHNAGMGRGHVKGQGQAQAHGRVRSISVGPASRPAAVESEHERGKDHLSAVGAGLVSAASSALSIAQPNKPQNSLTR